jgi:predicted lipoprotein with Yx(FWY)xxD motif
MNDPDVPPSAGVGGETQPTGNAGAAPLPTACIYQLDVERDPSGAAGAGGVAGAGGAGALGGEAGQGGESSSPTITKATSRLLGDYLADGSGRSLYVFGADLAGSCEALPVSDCAGDCLLSWPIFHAEQRILAPGIDEAAFGSFIRADGLPQTTYYGWPLYYYANDAKPGDITGHGSGVWGLAELILPNVIVRRFGMDRLLADGAGRTLYAFAEDTLGTPTSLPQSSCVGDCLEKHPPFSPRYVGGISTLEPRDLTSFIRSDGTSQVAYKGAPLYYSLLDDRPGAVNGAEDDGFTIVLK